MAGTDTKISDETSQAPGATAAFVYAESSANYRCTPAQLFSTGAANPTADVVFNESGADVDYRFEGDTNANLLVLDAGLEAVGVGSVPTDGLLHVMSASAGSVAADTAADELVIEASGGGGLSILTPDANVGAVYFGSPTDAIGAIITWDYTNAVMTIGPSTTSGDLALTVDAAVDAMKLTTSEVVINDGGADRDFRVEGDTATHALFVEGSTNDVLINTDTNSSSAALQVLDTQMDMSSSTVTASTAGGILIKEATPTTDYGVAAWFDHGGMKAGVASTRVNTSNWGTDLRFFTHKTATSDLSDVYERMRIDADGGVFHPSATGGAKGDNTINFGAVYDDNTLLSDYVLDYAIDGAIDHEWYARLELGGAAAREWDPAMLSIDVYEASWRERHALPAFRSRKERFDAFGHEIRDSIGRVAQGCQQELETHAVHIADLHHRLGLLER